MKSEPTPHSYNDLLAAPPYQPQPRAQQTNQQDPSSFPPSASTASSLAQKTPGIPPLTLVEKLNYFDAALEAMMNTYSPVLGRIVDKMACLMLAGFLVLVFTGVFVVAPILLVYQKVWGE
ncbi:hypothetical protein V495_06001 [Pseudogymnoascus sp. VKM F-4514 (FW-929)]|nr:hypothetical protein V495_06001 [Pseudogymnoascus sp. VKM F-4514 (FW-929)]